MSENFFIEHQGIIVDIRDGLLKIQIKTAPACGSCEAKSACMMAENGCRYIDVLFQGGAYKIGDTVTIVSRQSQKLRAVWWGYGIPFILILTTLILAHTLLRNELLVGFAACSVLALYYVGLFLFRDHFKKMFTFALKV